MGRFQFADDMTICDFRFAFEYDIGGDPDAPFCVWITSAVNGKPIWHRYFKEDGFNTRHVRNFCKKFAMNSVYREKCINSATKTGVLYGRNLMGDK